MKGRTVVGTLLVAALAAGSTSIAAARTPTTGAGESAGLQEEREAALERARLEEEIILAERTAVLLGELFAQTGGRR